MIYWNETARIYLHREPVDFRKAINGLMILAEQSMGPSIYDPAIFVFCNKNRDKLKVLYWDQTGFCLWHKRLEEETFKWPASCHEDTISLTHQQWQWLLSGYDISLMKPHNILQYQ